MTSDRDDDRRRAGGAEDPGGQGGQPAPESGRDTQLREELRARMRAIEAGRAAPKSALGPAAGPDRCSGPDEALGLDECSLEASSGSEGRRSSAFSGRLGSKRSGSKASGSTQSGSQWPGPQGSEARPFGSKPYGNSGFGGRAARPRRHDAGDSAESAWPEADRFEAQLARGGAESADPVPGGTAEDRPSSLFDESLSSPDGSGRGRRGRAPREQNPTQRALGLLTRREHSRKELTRKLTSRGLDAGEVETAVAKLAEAGWQNDGRFAESMVRSRAGNGYGPLHIRAELATHGLDSQAIADALAGYEGDWLQNARDLVRRRYGEDFAADPVRRRKAADLLMRRGFDGDTARKANRSGADD